MSGHLSAADSALSRLPTANPAANEDPNPKYYT
jgi:hypothetical protein